MTLAVFRCDASPAIGAGHAARCLALADAFAEAGCEILFATNREAPDTFPALRRHRLEIAPAMRAGELQWLGSLVEDKRATLILDLRETPLEYLTECRKRAHKLVVIADFPDRMYDCDILVDQTVGRTASEYASLVPANCKVLPGAQYALVGKSFLALRAEAGKRRDSSPAKNVLLAFGATDPFNFLGRLLPALIEHAPRLRFTIAASSRPLDDVRSLCEKYAARVSVLHSAENMPRAVLEAGLAVGLAGASAWERCALGLPSALFVPSGYYRLATERLAATGAAVLIGENSFDAQEAACEIAGLAANGARLARMSREAFVLCDGGGAQRIVNALC